ncbi:14276_t:CDS:10 [Dentiscutata erythropus]|uniref:Translation initiation factor eIF2B subunit epsilon n=1 Tax=Dentiscutata erythropus TaxID=1348616 RepID=A0A9N9JK78_9GLOM|nr:14276_t:CDS:10 [Dentiscutata erythropus]
MSPPSKTSGKNLESESILQAVVLADSFNERFRPITLDTPRCLLPLCNTPLIEYTLELLAVAGVQEVYLFCKEHSETINNYIKKSKWSRSYFPIRIITIVTPEARSVGDALRELDAKQLINSDFILINGDVVSNIHLEKVLEAHRDRKSVDGNTIMTMVVKEASPFHRTRSLGESPIFVLDTKTNECVHCESVELYPRKRRMTMDMEIDICSVEVPALFTENFDYQDIRKDFVHGILTSDLLGKTIYCHLVKDVYAARARNLHTYDAISKDVLSRWTYPIVPDSNLQEGDSYEFMRGHIYKEKDGSLSRSCSLGEKVLIGAGTEIAENVKITNSVIGRRVTIGPNVEINGAYIWDDVVIGPNVTLEPYTKLTKHKKTSESDNEGEESNEGAYDSTLIGEKGQGYIWTHDISNITLTDSDSPPSVIYDSSSDELSDSDESTTEEESLKEFFKEVSQTLERAFLDGHTVDIASLELNTLRMASNTTFHDLRVGVIPTILGQVDNENFLTSTEEVNVVQYKRILEKWGPLIGKLIHSRQDQIDALHILQDHCAKTQHHVKLFAPTIKKLYLLDILEEDAILEWNSSELADDDPSKSNIRKKAQAEVEDSDDDD